MTEQARVAEWAEFSNLHDAIFKGGSAKQADLTSGLFAGTALMLASSHRIERLLEAQQKQAAETHALFVELRDRSAGR